MPFLTPEHRQRLEAHQPTWLNRYGMPLLIVCGLLAMFGLYVLLLNVGS